MAKPKEKRRAGPRLTPKGTKPKISKKKRKLAEKKNKALKAVAEPSKSAAAPKPAKKRLAAPAPVPAPKKAKRVSFPTDMVQAKAIPDIDISLNANAAKSPAVSASSGLRPSTSVGAPTPTRSILKRREVKERKEVKGRAEDKSAKSPAAGEENRAPLDASLPEFGKAKKGKAGGLIVKKADKERLKTMSRKERKEFLRGLKAKRKVYFDVAVQAKAIWEKLRSGKTEKSAKEALTEQLRALVRGKVRQLMMAHDTTRVLQCLLSLGRQEIQDELWEEMAEKKTILLAAKSKYAHHILLKLVRSGSKRQRAELFRAIAGSVPSLFRNSFAAEVIELFYNDYANASQRRAIVFEFYGPHFRLFQEETGSGSLVELLAKEPVRKEGVVKELKEHLVALSSKPSLRHSLAHKLAADFFRIQPPAETKEEVVSALKERVVEMIHTKDGAVSGLHCLWSASAKDRRLLLRSMKDLVLKAAKEEHGHLFLLGLIDCVDDTVALNKILTKELCQHLHSLVKDANGASWGRKVLQYILHPRHKAFFPAEVATLLSEGDGNPFSKKDPATRHRELLSALIGPLLIYLGSNVEELVWEAPTSLFLLNAVQASLPSAGLSPEATVAASEGRRRIFEGLASLAAADFVPGDMENRLHLVEHKQGNFLLTRLLAADAELVQAGEASLAQSLAAQLSQEQLSAFTACNKGGFVLLKMWESGEATAVAVVKAIVGKQAKKLAAYSFASAGLLLSRVRDGKGGSGGKPLTAAHSRPIFTAKVEEEQK